jgi:hypothetical protein
MSRIVIVIFIYRRHKPSVLNYGYVTSLAWAAYHFCLYPKMNAEPLDTFI